MQDPKKPCIFAIFNDATLNIAYLILLSAFQSVFNEITIRGLIP